MHKEYSVLMSLYIKESPENLIVSISSMLNQTVVPNEIVIVQDGPLTNELEKVLSEFVNSYPKQIRVVRSLENIGLGLALNLGLKHCKNELVARMDTDDISLPVRCEYQLKAFADYPNLDICGTFVDEFNDSPDKIVSTRMVPLDHEGIYKFARRRSPFNHPTVMFKKTKVLSCGGYSDLRRNQDVDLFARMLLNGCLAHNIGKSLVLFRANNRLLKTRKNWTNTFSYIKTIRKLHKMGFSSKIDLFVITVAQLIIFVLPTVFQMWIYNKFLRKSPKNA